MSCRWLIPTDWSRVGAQDNSNLMIPWLITLSVTTLLDVSVSLYLFFASVSMSSNMNWEKYSALNMSNTTHNTNHFWLYLSITFSWSSFKFTDYGSALRREDILRELNNGSMRTKWGLSFSTDLDSLDSEPQFASHMRLFLVLHENREQSLESSTQFNKLGIRLQYFVIRHPRDDQWLWHFAAHSTYQTKSIQLFLLDEEILWPSPKLRADWWSSAWMSWSLVSANRRPSQSRYRLCWHCNLETQLIGMICIHSENRHIVLWCKTCCEYWSHGRPLWPIMTANNAIKR